MLKSNMFFVLLLVCCVRVVSAAGGGVYQNIVIGEDETAWNRVSMSTCAGLFGAERVEGKTPHVLRKPAFWKDMITRSQEAVAGYKNIVDAEHELRPMVEEVFEDNKKMMGDVWCESVEDLAKLATYLTSCAAMRSLLLVLFYLDIGDVPLLKTSHILTNKKPDVIPKAYERVMEYYYRFGQHAKYCCAQGMLFSCIDCLTACAQGSVLFALPTDLKDPWSIGFHQEKEKGYLKLFEHDWSHADWVTANRDYLNAIGPFLYEDFVKEILNVTGERWRQKGIEDAVAGYNLIHENIIVNLEKSSSWQGQGRSRFFKPAESIIVFDDSICDLVDEVHKKEDQRLHDSILQDWQEDLLAEVWGRLSLVDDVEHQKAIGAALCRDWLVGDDSTKDVVVNGQFYRDIAIKVLEELCKNHILSHCEKWMMTSVLDDFFPVDKNIFLIPLSDDMSKRNYYDRWSFRLPTRQAFSMWNDEQKEVFFRDMKKEIEYIVGEIDLHKAYDISGVALNVV